jgi:putative protease
VKGIKPEPMTLVSGKDRLILRFDCKKCEMHVIGKMKKHRSIPIVPIVPADFYAAASGHSA